MIYSARDRELLGSVYFLKRSRCYLEECSLEVITDNQVLKNFMNKKYVNRLETLWLDLLGQLDVSSISQKAVQINEKEGVLSQAPHAPDNLDVCNLEVTNIFEDNYRSDTVLDRYGGP